ncbi:MAG: ATP-dependent 6-phosphofructokinase [Planctomycetota bacterium]|jgi:6-phosphofructokinase 1
MEKPDFTIQNLGTPQFDSPISHSKETGDYLSNYVSDDQYTIYNTLVESDTPIKAPDHTQMIELAGPRHKIFFQPEKTHAAIVTCGGLCPGLNDVIRAIVMCLWYRYGVKNISGIKFGYRGFLNEFSYSFMPLDPDIVEDIHQKGGTILGSSRGYGNRTNDIIDALEKNNIDILFTIGGDGTQKGALNIANEINKRNLKIAMVGIPKTIDNDISFVQRSFGFETAVSVAAYAVEGAHTEAHDAPNGIGLVKVMGRQSGFIAAHTALAANVANFVLIPEIPFELDGPNGLLFHLHKRIEVRNHAVILAAEGAGQQLMEETNAADESGNPKLSDIGLFLKQKINEYFQQKQIEVNLKYIDPGYIIRSAPANPNDSIYCAQLGTNAAHAAMAGKTATLVALFNNHFVHIPTHLAVSKQNCIDPDGPLWRSVIEATGQPPLLINKHPD